MITLRQYLTERQQGLNSFNDLYQDAHFESFLDETLVETEREIERRQDLESEKETQRDVDIHNDSKIETDNEQTSGAVPTNQTETYIDVEPHCQPPIPYLDLVDSLVASAASANNTLGLGYVDLSTATLGIYNPSVSAAVAELKKPHWQMLHSRLGQTAFIDLVNQCRCYVPRGATTVNPDAKNLSRTTALNQTPLLIPHTNKSIPAFSTHYLEVFGRTPVHHHPRTLISPQGMLYGSPGPIVSAMPPHITNQTRFTKKLKKISYKDIYNTIVKNQNTPTPPKQVSAFLLTVVAKIFARQWSKPIRNKIFRAVASFVRLRRNARLSLSSIASDEVTLWLFETFICSLVKRFWYVTETGTSPALCFYPHPLWKHQTNSWLVNYQQRFLVQSHQCKTHGEGFKVYRHGKARLIPKSNNDFRLLCVPLKDIGYFSRLHSQIQPVRDILRYCLSRRPSRHPRCYSSDDLVRALNNYRASLPHDHGEIYLVKFDMRQSYDRLEQLKITEAVEKLIGATPCFYTRQYEHSASLKATFHKRSNLVTTSLETLSVDHLNHTVVKDKGHCTKFTKEGILAVIEEEMFHTALIHESKCYLRRRGVFQGCPLLATLCDVAYSDLVEERLLFLDEQSLLLRLADDFLVLSTDKQQIYYLYQLLKKDLFMSYGASANIAKTITNLHKPIDTILFVGIGVDTKSLYVWKNTDELLDLQPFELIYLRVLRQIAQVPVTAFSLERVLVPFNRSFPKLIFHHVFDEAHCLHFVLRLLEMALHSMTIEEFKMIIAKAWTHRELRPIVNAVAEI